MKIQRLDEASRFRRGPVHRRKRERAISRSSPADTFVCELAAGELLFRQGDHADCAYLIEDGAVEIFTGDENNRHTVAVLGVHEVFGEMALLGETTRSAGALTREPTRLTVIGIEFLNSCLARAEPLLRYLLRIVTERARHGLERGAEPESSLRRVAAALEQVDRQRALARVRLQRELEQALAGDEFDLYLQPVVHLDDGRLSGFEALLRWPRREGGPISPAEFIPVAEESDLINRIGGWIAVKACEALNRLPPQLSIAINLSARQLETRATLDEIGSALRKSGVSPSRLKLEVTETMLMRDIDRATHLLAACREAGLGIAIDDFGTGHSSLAYLHRLPVDTIKIDRSFVVQLHADTPNRNASETSVTSRAIVRGVVRLAHELGLEVVAEGVETAAQAQLLHLEGADLGQGFYYSPAVSLDRALAMARE